MPASSRGSVPQLGPRGEGWVVAQTVLLALVVAAQLVGPRSGVWWQLPPLAAGGVLLAWSAWALGPALSPFPRPLPTTTRRVRRGPYRFVAHPMYAGVLLACVAASLRAPYAWAPTVVLALVFGAKARLESRWLDELESR